MDLMYAYTDGLLMGVYMYQEYVGSYFTDLITFGGCSDGGDCWGYVAGYEKEGSYYSGPVYFVLDEANLSASYPDLFTNLNNNAYDYEEGWTLYEPETGVYWYEGIYFYKFLPSLSFLEAMNATDLEIQAGDTVSAWTWASVGVATDNALQTFTLNEPIFDAAYEERINPSDEPEDQIDEPEDPSDEPEDPSESGATGTCVALATLFCVTILI
jgi:hypothetical protein